MNYWGGDYVMGHIVRNAWDTDSRGFRMNLLTGVTEPLEVSPVEVAKALSWYADWFPKLVESSNSGVNLIAEAQIRVVVDPTIKRNYLTGAKESPFECLVSIVDDQGKQYSHEVKGWWYPEDRVSEIKKKPWWKFW